MMVLLCVPPQLILVVKVTLTFHAKVVIRAVSVVRLEAIFRFEDLGSYTMIMYGYNHPSVYYRDGLRAELIVTLSCTWQYGLGCLAAICWIIANSDLKDRLHSPQE